MRFSVDFKLLFMWLLLMAPVQPDQCNTSGFIYIDIVGCIYIDQNPDGLDWQTALDFCSVMDTGLVEIHNASVQAQIMVLLSDIGGDYWIGLTDEGEEGSYIWQYSQLEATFTPWGGQQPDGGESENCVALNMDNFYYWADSDCSEKRRPICQEAESLPHPCGNDAWKYWQDGDRCYWRDKDEVLLTFQQALDLCEELGAELVALETESENNFVKTWLTDIGAGDFWWLALSDVDQEGLHVWVTTGQEANYTDWYPTGHHGDNYDYSILYGPYHYRWTEVFQGDMNSVICERVR